MRAELANLNHCAVPFLSRVAVNLSWYDSSITISISIIIRGFWSQNLVRPTFLKYSRTSISITITRGPRLSVVFTFSPKVYSSLVPRTIDVWLY